MVRAERAGLFGVVASVALFALTVWTSVDAYRCIRNKEYQASKTDTQYHAPSSSDARSE